ncbi:decarboxylase [Candidatus Woesearchaeota archaeon]|nr:decarboxylase [Candidatus Woesearchaeota archaeon]
MARFTLSKGKVLEQHDKVAELADVVSYSSKTNPAITPILEEERDCLFSIHTEHELKHVNDRSRILFLAQGLTPEQLDRLASEGITRYVVDNEEDLDTVLAWLERHEGKISLMLRVRLKERSVRTERYFVFGIPAATVEKRIRELEDHEKIEELGVHFHRKSQNVAEWNLTYEIGEMFGDETMKRISVLNIGGGLPSVYANTNEDVFTGIYRKVEELKGWLHEKDVKLMMEPGRYIAAPAGKLHTTIKLVYENTIIVDASVYNSDMDALIVPVKLLVEGELEKGQGKPYIIKGTTPCNMDLYRYRAYLEDPRKGDELVFLNAGAYNFSTDFCDLETLETEVVE